jgi:hypothetical protein
MCDKETIELLGALASALEITVLMSPNFAEVVQLVQTLKWGTAW